MNADRWKAVKDLFEAALAVHPRERVSFLDQRCAGDGELRQEVDSLLEAHTDAGDFLDKAPTTTGGLSQNTGNLAGQSLGPYRVIELIGEGGMGAVYLARDERLKRKVAIKTLHASLAWDSELIERLKLEARAESSINHPNICTVYDVGEWKGVPYIVMEYLEGEPLRSKMLGKPLAVEEIYEIGSLVARALEAAHAMGIIHRDVKPGNIFLTKDGQVKIMDFGVAKRMPRRGESPRESTARAGTEALTRPWIRVGTVTHMSPEQAKGEKIDGRSDLFSLGSVLYEMTTGRPPFRADGPQAVMDAIISSHPRPPAELNAAIPGELQRIILKTLEKDTARRYQTAGDLAADLLRLQRAAGSGHHMAVAVGTGADGPPGRGRKPAVPWMWAAAAIVVVAATLWLMPQRELPLAPTSVTSLATLRGIRECPVISPRGDMVAFAWTGERGDVNDKEIYVQSIGSGGPLKVTEGPGTAEAPAWSPDGLSIAFLRPGLKERGFYVAPANGGPARLLAPAVDPPPRAGAGGSGVIDWSPDGKTVVIADREEENGLRVLALVDVATRERRLLGVRHTFVSNPTFSPDGSTLAFTMGPSFLSHDIYIMPAGGGTPRQITTDKRWIAGITWTADGSRLVFASRRAGPFSLWSVPSSGGTVRPVAQSGTDVFAPNIGRKFNRLVYARTKINRNLWRMKLGGNGGAKEIIYSTRTSFQPDYSPDGKRIAFASDRTGSHEIWLGDSEGQGLLQLTKFEGAQTGSPRWSPDGEWIAFDSRPDGHSDIYVVLANGGKPRRLTEEPSDDRTPAWSADGRSLYFVSNRTGRNQLWSVPLAGGQATQITADGATYAAADEGGREIYYTNGRGLWKRRESSKGAPELISEEFPLLGWRLLRGALHYGRADEKGMYEIVGLDVATGKKGTLVRLGQRSGDFDTFTISPDGQWLLFDRVDKIENEVVLVANYR